MVQVFQVLVAERVSNDISESVPLDVAGAVHVLKLPWTRSSLPFSGDFAQVPLEGDVVGLVTCTTLA